MAITRLSEASMINPRKYGKLSAGMRLVAKGGVVDTTSAPGYVVHTFNSNGTFEIEWASEDISVEYLVIAGGGSGGGSGGGGAGGYRTNILGQTSGRNSSSEPALLLGKGQYTCAVGAGGGNSTFHTITSTRGGNGAGRSGTGASGGAGGGGGSSNPTGFPGGAGTAGQGFNGGGGGGDAGLDGYGGGGGGAGGTPTGLSSNITGSSVTRASGGSAQRFTAVACQSGTNSGGGGRRCVPGAANTGGGGGAGGGGTGGSGVVIVRYLA